MQYQIDTCNFFNLFLHSDYVKLNRNADLNIFKCSKDSKAILDTPAQSGKTPGFRVCLRTTINQVYYLEIDAVLMEGKDAFIYIEDMITGERLLPRESRFPLCDRKFYCIEFTATSQSTGVGILFLCNDIANKLQIYQFRLAPFLTAGQLAGENVAHWKCVTGQLGQPIGCTGCTDVDTSEAVELFQGPSGPTGSTGPQGPQGSIGVSIVGPVGPTGLQGTQGTPGPQGIQGGQGIQGPQGPTGPQGPVGPVGREGPQGPQGDIGPRGFQGISGPVGSIGPRGATGATGSGPITGTWTTSWNRTTGGGVTMTDIAYQLTGRMVTLLVPSVTFDPPIGGGVISTISSLPGNIVPTTSQAKVIILTVSGTNRSVRLTIGPGGINISSNLAAATNFGIETVELLNTNVTYLI